jgi:hypothetical protein
MPLMYVKQHNPSKAAEAAAAAADPAEMAPISL